MCVCVCAYVRMCVGTCVAASEVLAEVSIVGDKTFHVAAVSGDDGQSAAEPVSGRPLRPR